MSKIFLTGDIHGHIDIDKLKSYRFKRGQKLTKDDYLIILGDFGLIFYQENGILAPQEKKNIEWLNSQPWTTLFIDGNHENFDRLWNTEKYPEIEYYGGKASKIADSIYYLHRGQVFNLDGKTFFTMGGALSIDKYSRTSGISWWPEEDIRDVDMEKAFKNLAIHNNKVDYVLTHTCPDIIFKDLLDRKYMAGHIKHDPNTDKLQEIYDKIEFKKWYFGHFHIEAIQEDYASLYHTIIELKD